MSDPPADVLREYSIGNVIGAIEIPGGRRSRLWRITASEGDYVLREANAEFGADRVALAARCQQHLSGHLLAPELLPPRGGGGGVESGGRFYSMSRFVESVTRALGELRSGEWRPLGALLGRVHDALQGFCPGGVQKSFLLMAEEPEQSLADLVTNSRPGSLVATHVARRIKWLRDMPRADLVRAWSLPRQWLHGDFWVENILFSPSTADPVMVLDFDQTCVFLPQYEIVRAYASSRAITGESDEGSLAELVAGYVATRGPNAPALIDAIPIYLWVSLSDTRPYSAILDGDLSMVPFVNHRMKIIERTMERRDLLQRAIELGVATARAVA